MKSLQKYNYFYNNKIFMKKNNLPASIVNEMMRNDFFSQWLGIEVVSINEGNCELRMKIRKEMLNGFGIAHGGIAFSLADSALAFASNSGNRKSLVLDASMSFLTPVNEHDVLTATAVEHNSTRKTGIYLVEVVNQDARKVALFKGIVFRKNDEWFPQANNP
jgi:acyl-CoA thioesterase